MMANESPYRAQSVPNERLIKNAKYLIALISPTAVAGTVYIHYIFTTNEPTPPSRVPSRLLYNATK